MFTLYNKYITENHYVGNGWNFEKTSKYIFVNGQEYIEAGYFIHYLKTGNHLEEKKHVIELPSSYGCQMKCGFCASSRIVNTHALPVEEIYEIFTYIMNHNHLEKKKDILVSMMGIGDLYFTINTVEKLLQKIHDNYGSICFSVSSCHWTETMLTKIETLNNFMNFRTIQVTYITHDTKKAQDIIPYYKKNTYDINAIIQMIQQSSIDKFKINYILIKGFNDSDEDFTAFIAKFNEIKNKLIIRISRINVTQASETNGIASASVERMLEFRENLLEQGYQAYLFYSHKNDNMNCGQLITEKM